MICGLAGLLGLTAAHAGSISGIVKAKGPPEVPQQSGDDAYQSRRYKFAEKIDYEHLRDFVVYIDQAMPAAPGGAATEAVTTQKDASFEPHVLPIVVGTTVRWPNEDEIFHNVFSMSDAKPFDLGYYKKDKVPEITFDRPGQVDVYCAIHTKMHCIILVLPNRFYAKADEKGRYVIKDVPAGTYKLRAWHERLPGQVQEIVVPEQGDVKVDITLGLAALPKY
jgi:plastocyanin